MSNLLKLGLAVGLGIAAAVMNLIYLSSKTTSKSFVALKSNLEAGQEFPREGTAYGKIDLPASETPPTGSLVPYEQRSLLFGLEAAQDFTAGDPIFFRDIQQDLPRYERLGPFKLLSVGSSFIGEAETDEYRSSEGGGVITVAPILKNKEYDESTRKLLQIVDAGRDRDKAGKSHLRIVAIEANPRSSAASPLGELSGNPLIEEQDRALFVPIQGVANIPDVLTIGTEITFLVPAYP